MELPGTAALLDLHLQSMPITMDMVQAGGGAGSRISE